MSVASIVREKIREKKEKDMKRLLASLGVAAILAVSAFISKDTVVTPKSVGACGTMSLYAQSSVQYSSYYNPAIGGTDWIAFQSQEYFDGCVTWVGRTSVWDYYGYPMRGGAVYVRDWHAGNYDGQTSCGVANVNYVSCWGKYGFGNPVGTTDDYGTYVHDYVNGGHGIYVQS